MSASADQINWVLTSYIVAAAIMTPPSGFLANRFGRKRVYIIGSILTGIFAQDLREHWVAKMKSANVPVGYLRTVEEGFNAPEVRDRHRLSRIQHPTAGSVPNIESPLSLSLTPIIDPVAAPLLGQHTNDVLRQKLGYDDDQI